MGTCENTGPWEDEPDLRAEVLKRDKIIYDLRAEVANLKDALIDCGHDLEKAQKKNASLKEELVGKEKQLRAAKMIIDSKEIVQAYNGERLKQLDEAINTLDSERQANENLTQQLAAAKEYAERLREALEAQKVEGNVNQMHAALGLPKPWE